jgi:hypothetical protein
MINIFFQEWAPLFPILHRPTFLTLYEQYVSSPDTMVDKKSITQLNLVFGIAALSSDVSTTFHPLKPSVLTPIASRWSRCRLLRSPVAECH